MALVDTHCHLNFESFDKDCQSVLERAVSAGIVRILVPGIDLLSSKSAVKMAGDYDSVFAAIGVHPNEASTWDQASFDDLKELAKQPKVAAIGEIGLDYYWERSPASLQRAVLEKQLKLAAELGLPVVIHVRDRSPGDLSAMQDVLAILKDWQQALKFRKPELSQQPGVLHSFSGDKRAALEASQINFRIGITGPVTYKKADQLREVVAGVPEEYLLVETDAPFLSPHPYRGKRNEPAWINFIAEEIAAIRQTSVEHIAKTTSLNAERLFRW